MIASWAMQELASIQFWAIYRPPYELQWGTHFQSIPDNNCPCHPRGDRFEWKCNFEHGRSVQHSDRATYQPRRDRRARKCCLRLDSRAGSVIPASITNALGQLVPNPSAALTNIPTALSIPVVGDTLLPAASSFSIPPAPTIPSVSEQIIGDTLLPSAPTVLGDTLLPSAPTIIGGTLLPFDHWRYPLAFSTFGSRRYPLAFSTYDYRRHAPASTSHDHRLHPPVSNSRDHRGHSHAASANGYQYHAGGKSISIYELSFGATCTGYNGFAWKCHP